MSLKKYVFFSKSHIMILLNKIRTGQALPQP